MERIRDFLEDQRGLVTRQQMSHMGIGKSTIHGLCSKHGPISRVANGIYLLKGSPVPDNLDLRAAWLQLAPSVSSWSRTVDDGVVSHRSAASIYKLGELPADRFDFTSPMRRQSRRSDVKIRCRELKITDWVRKDGLLVTRPSRFAVDLLAENEDPEAVSRIVADAIRGVSDYAGRFAENLAPQAARFGLRKGDGIGLLRWLLALTNEKEADLWMAIAIDHMKTQSFQQVEKKS